MKLSIWTYEGPPHVGAMRVATAMEKLHFVLHAPQGDTYADLLFTMIERGNKRHQLRTPLFKQEILVQTPLIYLRKRAKRQLKDLTQKLY